MKTVVLSPNCTLIHADCRSLLGTLAFDAIVTDPPYGIDFVHSGISGGIKAESRKAPILGDKEEFDPEHLLNLLKGDMKDLPLVLFGANHFSHRLPPSAGWLCWDKSCGQGPAATFSDAEFILMNRRNPRMVFHHFWAGALRSGEARSRKRLHVSEKPVELMLWLLDTARIGLGKTVLDPYMGSGSTGVACLRSGRKFIGIELDPDIFQIAHDRLAGEIRDQSEQLSFSEA